jgi:glycosyltransferase involved in cell wall biosynthesis
LTSSKISIVTVARNCVVTIEDTILSVARQSYPHVEHILVDGASTDGTLEIVNRHLNKFSKTVSEPDMGIYDAMNKGIRLATGDVVGFLNADDVYSDANVLGEIAAIFNDATVSACYGDLVYMDESLTRVVRYWKSRPYRDGLFEKGWMPAHPTFFVRRAVFERYGDFDLAFRFQSDFDLTMRFLSICKIQSVYLPRVLVKMRVGGATNKSATNVIKGNIEAYQICKKNGLRVTPLFIVKKILSRVPQFFSKSQNL